MRGFAGLRVFSNRGASRRTGFTLLEMMVALAAGALVITTVYTISASASRHFQEQQRISQLQLSLRLALDRLRRDIARAGLHATMDSLIDRNCGQPPQRVRGLEVIDRSPVSMAALRSMTGFAEGNGTHGDQLRVTGNFRTGDAYLVRDWVGNQLRLATQFLAFRRSFTADPNTGAIDPELFARTFAPGTAIMVRLGAGLRAWGAVDRAIASADGQNATIMTARNAPNCMGQVGLEGWFQGGATVAPISTVE
ncbi:MAG: prepilin-type N-terminal cleavage/methylation domain-containing protein, partial [Sandaracinaceae bacterium]|nr:prepilin-type N-terminal cleavage/methylation domain-containing protein [Sandaracinaceae bacterium]